MTRDRHQRDRRRPEQLVDLELQRRGRVAELARLAGDLLGVAVLAHGIDFVAARARDPERAREHPVSGPLADPVRLAGEQRLVDAQPARLHHRAVGDELVARLDSDDVARHDLVAAELDQAAVADHLRARRDQERELVERLLGLQLLADADARVDDRDQAEERVRPQPEREDEDEEDADDRVEERQRVGDDDARHRAARRGLGRAEPRETPRRLRARESLGCRRCFHEPI